MARILLAWELGNHLGHLGRLLPVAQALRRAGHQTLFAVCNMRSAEQVLTPRGFEYVQAPLLPQGVRPRQPPISYAELLLAEGFADRDSLSGVLRAWSRLFELFRPDLILADHSPSVLVAARRDGIAVVPIGNGFEIPPNASPMPSIRVWETIGPARLVQAEVRVLQAINKHLGSARRLQRLADLFHEQPVVIAWFAELDHYRERSSCEYAGPLFSSVPAEPCPWSQTHCKVFAYLHNGLNGLPNLLHGLRTFDAVETVCVVSGISAAACRHHSARNLRILNRPVELSSALAADIVVAQGGAIAAQFLLAGRPALLVPGTVEQVLLCRRIEELGAGLAVAQERTVAAFADGLQRLLSGEDLRDRARAFAAKYAGFTTDAAAAKTAALVESRLLAGALH